MGKQIKLEECSRKSCYSILKEIYTDKDYGGWGILILPFAMLPVCIMGIWNLVIVRIFLLAIIFFLVEHSIIYLLHDFRHYTTARVLSFILSITFIFVLTTYSKLVIKDDSVPIWLKCLYIIFVAGMYLLALFFIQDQCFQIAYALLSYFYSIYFEDIVLKAKEKKQNKIIENIYKFLNWWTQDWSKK